MASRIDFLAFIYLMLTISSSNDGAAAVFILASTRPPPRSSFVKGRADPFDIFTTMRTGVGSGPGSSEIVFWAGNGTLYEAYSGNVLAHFEGFDVEKGIQLDQNTVRQLSRKIFWFLDPDTHKVMKSYQGKPVQPIQYDFQVFDFVRGPNGQILPSVVYSERKVPVMPITSEKMGDHQMLFQAPVFLDLQTPNAGRYQAWEFYDYHVDPSFPADRPPTAVFCRQGSTPPFNTNNQAVMRFVGYRVDAFDDLPESMKDFASRKYPLFCGPPKDMAEVQMPQTDGTDL